MASCASVQKMPYIPCAHDITIIPTKCVTNFDIREADTYIKLTLRGQAREADGSYKVVLFQYPKLGMTNEIRLVMPYGTCICSWPCKFCSYLCILCEKFTVCKVTRPLFPFG